MAKLNTGLVLGAVAVGAGLLFMSNKSKAATSDTSDEGTIISVPGAVASPRPGETWRIAVEISAPPGVTIDKAVFEAGMRKEIGSAATISGMSWDGNILSTTLVYLRSDYIKIGSSGQASGATVTIKSATLLKRSTVESPPVAVPGGGGSNVPPPEFYAAGNALDAAGVTTMNTPVPFTLNGRNYTGWYQKAPTGNFTIVQWKLAG